MWRTFSNTSHSIVNNSSLLANYFILVTFFLFGSLSNPLNYRFRCIPPRYFYTVSLLFPILSSIRNKSAKSLLRYVQTSVISHTPHHILFDREPGPRRQRDAKTDGFTTSGKNRAGKNRRLDSSCRRLVNYYNLYRHIHTRSTKAAV